MSLIASGIAHDLNNFLTGILGNMHLLKLDLEKQDDLFQILQDTEKASVKAKILTHQLLNFAKDGTPIKKTSSIRQLIKETVSFALSGSKIICDLTIDDDLYPVDYDEGQIGRVINNLIINAKQSESSDRMIHLSAKNVSALPKSLAANAKKSNTGKYVKISVKDKGKGIPGHHLSKIFSPYFTTKKQGSGLGLAIAQSIVQKHNGFLTVKSKENNGTTFSIYLPAAPLPLPGMSGDSGEIFYGSGKILLLENETIIINTVNMMLERLGYFVVTTTDSEKTVELYKHAFTNNCPFQLVILDLTIPGMMTGIEVMEELKKIDPDVNAVMTSGYTNSEKLANYKQFGFRDIIKKPFSIKELSTVLKQVVSS